MLVPRAADKLTMRILALALLALGISAAPVLADGRTQARPGVGGSLTVRSDIYGSTVRITLRKVIDPATPSYPAKLRPRPGHRWVAIQLSVRGLRGTWTDAPATDGRLTDASRRLHKAFLSGYGTVEPRLPMGLALTPGRVVVGNLVFELARAARLRTFEYVVTGGTTGIWDLTR
jgi:hypothetical protein